MKSITYKELFEFVKENNLMDAEIEFQLKLESNDFDEDKLTVTKAYVSQGNDIIDDNTLVLASSPDFRNSGFSSSYTYRSLFDNIVSKHHSEEILNSPVTISDEYHKNDEYYGITDIEVKIHISNKNNSIVLIHNAIDLILNQENE